MQDFREERPPKAFPCRGIRGHVPSENL